MLVVLAFAWYFHLSSVLGVDNRTFAQMIYGIRKHGWPYNLNAASEQFAELRPRFNIPREGKNWGVYPPVYPYFAAPLLALGGFSLVNRMNVILVGLVGVLTHLGARRLARSPMWGAAAGAIVVLATPLWPGSIETMAQPLMEVFCVGALLLAFACIWREDGWRARLLGFGAGLLSGLGAESHLIGAPMALMLIAAIAWARWRRKLPRAAWLVPALSAACGFALVLLPVAFLNHWRFATYNPITYGPCVWEECKRSVGNSLNAASLGRFILPPMAWYASVAVASFLSLKRPRLGIGLLAACALALVPDTVVRLRVWQVFRTVFGYFVDVTNFEFGTWGDGPGSWGHMWAGQLCKGLLQCSPILALALTAFLVRRRSSDRAFVVLAPLVGIVGSIAVLARFREAHAFGWPHLFMRYSIPAAPYLAILAATVLARLEWRRWHAALFAVVALTGLVVYFQSTDDFPLYRRVISLRVTLAVAAIAVIAATAALRYGSGVMSKLAPPAAAIATALALTINVGADSAAMVRQCAGIQRKFERFAALTPARFAIVGWGIQIDEVLAIGADRDIVYWDLGESKGWGNMRWYFDRWKEEGRPVYGIFPAGRFSWPYADWDVTAEQIDETWNIWRIDPPKVPAPGLPEDE